MCIRDSSSLCTALFSYSEIKTQYVLFFKRLKDISTVFITVYFFIIEILILHLLFFFIFLSETDVLEDHHIPGEEGQS